MESHVITLKEEIDKSAKYIDKTIFDKRFGGLNEITNRLRNVSKYIDDDQRGDSVELYKLYRME